MGLSDRWPPLFIKVILVLVPQKADLEIRIVWEIIPENTVREKGSERREEKQIKGVLRGNKGPIPLEPFRKTGQNTLQNYSTERKESRVTDPHWIWLAPKLTRGIFSLPC